MSLKVCRVCAAEGTNLTQMGSGVNSCGKKLAACIPEIDLYLVEDPVICKTCSHMVDVAYTLRELCLRNEKRLTVSLENHLSPSKQRTAASTDDGDDAVVYVSDDECNNVKVTANNRKSVVKDLISHVVTPNVNCCSSSFYCSICDQSFIGDSLDSHHKEFHLGGAKSADVEAKVAVINKIIARRVNMSNNVPMQRIKPKRKSTLLDNVYAKKASFECKNCKATFDSAVAFGKHVELRNCLPGEKNGLITNEISGTADRLHAHVQLKSKISGIVNELHAKSKISGTDNGQHAEINSKISGIDNGLHVQLKSKISSTINELHAKSNISGTDNGQHADIKSKISGTDNGLQVEVKYICDVCGESFVHPSDLELHSSTHLKNACQLCDKTFASKIELEKHVEFHFTKCCDTKFQTGCAIQLHTYYQHGKSCGICTASFDTFNALFQHLVVHADKKLDFRCIDCNISFNDEEQYSAHRCGKERCEDDTPQSNESDVTSKQPTSTSEDCEILCQSQVELDDQVDTPPQSDKLIDAEPSAPTQTWTCEDCMKAFDTLIEITEHQCVSYNCKYCGYLFLSKFVYNIHLLEHSIEKDLPCNLCSSRFTSKASLILHLKSHYTEICQVCYQAFKTAKLLTRHYITVHCKMLTVALVDYKKHGLSEVSKKYFCRACRTEYSSLHSFHTHVREAHAYCEACNCTITRIDYMLAHINRHEDCARPKVPRNCQTAKASNQLVPELRLQISNTAYFCETCQVEFQDKTKYADHVQYTHTKLNTSAGFCQICQIHFKMESKYCDHMKIVHRQCHMCEKSFDNGILLSSHIKTHELSRRKKKCSQCGKKFINKANLQKHISFCHKIVCHICKKTFKHLNHLKCHFRSHVNNKVKCSFCDKHFKTQSKCDLHVQLMHPRCTIEGDSVNDDDEHVPVEEHVNEQTVDKSCGICKNTFESMDILMRHVHTSHLI